MKETYSFEILLILRGACKGTDIEFTTGAHYTASGIEAPIRDRWNGQIYKITIEPVEETALTLKD